MAKQSDVGTINFADGTMQKTSATLSPAAHGYVSASAASAAITAETYLNVLANATVDDAGNTDTSYFTVDNTNKRVIYIGEEDIRLLINITFSFTSSKNGAIARFKIYKNGVALDSSHIDRYVSTGAQVGAGSLQTLLSLSQNDYIEMWGTLSASTSDTITVTRATVIIR